MKSLVDGLRLIMRRGDSKAVAVVSVFVIFLILLLVQNGRPAFDMITLDSFSLSKRVSLFLSILFDVGDSFSLSAIVLLVLGSILGGINISLAYTYFKIRGEMILRSGFYSGTGLIFAFIGIGCAACGTALLSLILGAFGYSAVLLLLPYKGEEIGYVGLIILLFATYSLSKKATAPNVC